MMDVSEAGRLFQLAVGHQEAGRVDEAQPIYERILRHFPNFPHVPHLLGAIMGQRGDWFLARRLIESSLFVHPNDADALVNLSWTLFNLGEYAEVVARCDEAIALRAADPRAWLTRGMALSRMGQPEDAIESFDRALALRPDLVEALNHRGRCLQALRRHEAALQDFDKALVLLPGFVDVHNNRGAVLASLGRAEEAMASFRQALALAPRFVEAHFNLGLALQKADRPEEALACFEAIVQLDPMHLEAHVCRAHMLEHLQRQPYEALAGLDRVLAVRPDHVDALYLRGSIPLQLKHHAQALANYDRAIALKPGLHQAHQGRANALLELGRRAEAAQAYRESARLGGDARSAQFALAALGEEPVPATAPRDFVVNLFDHYADRFDEHLVGQLQYRGHQAVCEAILGVRPAGAFDILDLGCGTGLCGPLLQPIARTLVGVDLSPRMLEAARERGYTALAEDDIVAFMQKGEAASFDVIAAADVFVYIGDLREVFAAASRSIRPGGVFAFSIESSEQEDFVLRPSRRFAHSAGYIRRLAAAHGFEVSTLQAVTLRKESESSLPAWLVVLQAG